jgi:ribosome-binding ATPase YchF (GTP1/OBG family)
VIHVAGKVDPIADIEVIQTELCLADLATVEKAINRYSKAAKSGNDKEAAKLVSLLTPIQAAQRRQACPHVPVSKEDAPLLKPFCLITAKPAMFVGNVSEDGFENNPLLDRLKAYADAQGARWWPSAPRSKPRWPRWTTPTATCSWPSWAWKSRA